MQDALYLHFTGMIHPHENVDPFRKAPTWVVEGYSKFIHKFLIDYKVKALC